MRSTKQWDEGLPHQLALPKLWMLVSKLRD
jgi:hypothetical protein